MEHIAFEGVNLAELLPRIPDSIKDGLPFGLVKLDLVGTILEYNMAEGDLTGVDPKWAIGKNFFDDVALCTKTQAFYGRFVEGVKKGFLNVVFDYTFDHRELATKVKVHMVTIPNHLGQKNVMILVKRANRPLVQNAFAMPHAASEAEQDFDTETRPVPLYQAASPAPQVGAQGAAPSIADIVNAVIAAMNNGANAAQLVTSAPSPTAAPAAIAKPASPTAAPPAAKSGSRHEDILKF